MKQSVYRAARVAEHRRRLAEYSEVSVEEWTILKTESDVEAAEAAGVVWDPEEEPLPEKLEIANSATIVDSKARPSPIILPFDRFWETAAARDAAYAEAVRRYNAWPELWQLVKDHDTATSMRLRLILLGKDGDL